MSSSGPSKAFYMSTINLILPINLLCGLFPWFTQFLLPCSASRLHALMALASQVFLANIIAVLLVYLLLFALHDADPVNGWRNRLVQWQLIITALSMSVGFMFLAICIPIGYINTGDSRVGVFGAVLFGILIFAAIFVGFSTAVTRYSFPLAENSARDDDVPQLNRLQFAPVLALIVLEAVMFIALIAVGGRDVGRTPIYTPCTAPEMILLATNTQPLPVIVENPSLLKSLPAQTITINQSATVSSDTRISSASGTASKTVAPSAQTPVVTVINSTVATVLTTISTIITL